MNKKDTNFIGRNPERKLLNNLLSRKISSLAVIKGRRRVGKSRLAEEFAQHADAKFFHFSGLAPTQEMTAQDQRNEFALQLSQQTVLPEIQTDDWAKLFLLLASQCESGRTIILFDEITWMAHKDHTFLAKLKNAWDMRFKKNPKLILILCGSISAWIEKNILSDTGYFGRISLNITLKELSLPECNQLFNVTGFQQSAMEKLIVLSLTGGIPWYIEQIHPKYSALENIKSLCFSENALLKNEYRHIFHDLFGSRSEIYQRISQTLAKKDLEYNELSTALNYSKSSALSDYLNELIMSGYITEYHSWNLKTGKIAPKLKKYRLSDNFLRFFFHYMANKQDSEKLTHYAEISPSQLPGWNSILGLQFENLVLKNSKLIHDALSIKPENIIASGPYFQRKTSKQDGCQIDYLIHTKYNTLYVCEIKFSQHSIDTEVIKEIKQKIERLKLSKGFAAIPVLIHANQITDALKNSDELPHIIDFSQHL